MRRHKSAADALANWEPTESIEVYGFTKGAFGFLDLLLATLNKTGPADLSLSTWTAHASQIGILAGEQSAGRITSGRFLFDTSFVKREPQTIQAIRKHFGHGAVRVCLTHSKFALLTGKNTTVTLRTSANLNLNKRFEDFTISADPELHKFLTALLDDFWTNQRPELADQSPGQIAKYWRDQM